MGRKDRREEEGSRSETEAGKEKREEVVKDCFFTDLAKGSSQVRKTSEKRLKEKTAVSPLITGASENGGNAYCREN